MVRKASIKDVRAIFDLVEHFAVKGTILARPISSIYSNIRDFLVYEEDGSIVAACALHVCWEDLGEIRSLVVKEEAKGRGIQARIKGHTPPQGLAGLYRVHKVPTLR
jgi:amino-acid N-acetyltransferase